MILKNITSDGSTSTTVTTVVGRNPGKPNNRTGFRAMTISNNHASNLPVISINLYDGTNVFYICQNVKIPYGATLLFDNSSILNYDINRYMMRVSATGTANQDLTVIIK